MCFNQFISLNYVHIFLKVFTCNDVIFLPEKEAQFELQMFYLKY